MASDKLQYDAAQGGKVALPTHVTTYHYAAGALNEIKTLVRDAVEGQPGHKVTKLIFQSLPKHMRRRAMSHHPKRLPRQYRQAHNSQMSKGGNKPVTSKRPSRKYRRRPANLLAEYVRRQRKHIWLETHIWHAKRFHMAERWGYRLALSSCDKTYRACYRASAEHCLLQDVSFYTCYELRGLLGDLIKGFARLTSPRCGLDITARTYLNGRREGTVELFEDGRFPFGALQRANFMWLPSDVADAQAERTMWLWLHPSAANATLEQLIKVFELRSHRQQKLPLVEEETQKESEPTQPDEEPKKQAKNKLKKQPDKDGKEMEQTAKKPLRFWTVTKAFERTPAYSNANNSMHLVILQREFNRFRLTGPRAQKVLAASLRAHQANTGDLLEQSDYVKAALQLDSPSEVLSNLVMGVQVVDPRLQRPRKRTKAEPRPDKSRLVSPSDLLVNQPKILPESRLWCQLERDRLSKNIMSLATYEELRGKHVIVPGEPCPFEEKLQAVPLLLVQRPGSQDPVYKRLGYGSGWDVIAPAGYGMILWLTLTMWGARPGGLRELESVARESGTDLHLPDTVAGKSVLPSSFSELLTRTLIFAGIQEAAVATQERRVRYFRLPPGKRINYRKLAICSPFSAPWKQLVRDWSSRKAEDSYFVLRYHQQLETISYCLLQKKPFPASLPDKALIQVKLRLLARGRIKDNALICVPQIVDFRHRQRQIRRNCQGPAHVEPAQPDLNEPLRRELRRNHKITLKRLRGRRVREKRRLQEKATTAVHIRPANTAALVRSQLEEMCRLWLPGESAEVRDSVRRQCSREVIGYVTVSAFSFTEATVCSVGYVTVAGLQQLIFKLPKTTFSRKESLKCLLRDPDSKEYRWASIQINLNIANSPL
ncbi:hypothetical protein KR018_002097 [Drosophila ironensis]|nr:hypothetical protein KR018_002097 [Drosophila ironensis]